MIQNNYITVIGISHNVCEQNTFKLVTQHIKSCDLKGCAYEMCGHISIDNLNCRLDQLT